jgi:hypothetical protein
METQATFGEETITRSATTKAKRKAKEWYAELEAEWGTVDHVLVTHPDAESSVRAAPRALYAVSGSPAAAGRPREIERVHRHPRAPAVDSRPDAGA